MKSSTIAWGVLIIAVVAGGGWYWYSSAGNSSTATPSTTLGLNGSSDQGNLGQPDNGTPQTPGQTTATVLAVSSNASVGSFLTAPLTGMTLYLTTNDKPGVSSCAGQCAVNWPPYLVEPGATLLGDVGVKGQLGTIARADGATQLTYNGIPLYTYSKDAKPGDTTGHGVNDAWYVVAP